MKLTPHYSASTDRQSYVVSIEHDELRNAQGKTLSRPRQSLNLGIITRHTIVSVGLPKSFKKPAMDILRNAQKEAFK